MSDPEDVINKEEEEEEEDHEPLAVTAEEEREALLPTTTTTEKEVVDGDPVEEVTELMMDSSSGIKKKARNRPRKKKMYSEICQQIEFYFSDSNISKNRMMQDLVNASEYVELKVFFTFHKIQKLNPDGDIVILQKALANSTFLTLSTDLLGVKRKISYDPSKLKSENEIEQCTIYVENIPPHFDHDKLKKIFSEFGPVAYVAIPKARQSGLSKGFAFVEFQTFEVAESCLNAYGDIGACLSGNMDPSDLMSVKTFEPPPPTSTHSKIIVGTRPVEHSTKNTRGKKRPLHDENVVEGKEEDGKEQQPPKKSKITTTTIVNGENESLTTDDNVTSTQQGDGDDDETVDSSSAKQLTDPPPPVTAVGIKSETASDNKVSSSNSDENQNKSREKKRRRKNYKNKKIESIEQCESESIQLRIMAKRNWKQLRSRYLNVQREHLSKLKHQLRHQRPPPLPSQHNSTEKKEDQEEVKELKHVLVKITFPQPIEDVETFKSKVKNEIMPSKWSTALKYIDCTPNQTHAIIKIDGHVIEAVSKFIHNASSSSDFQDVEVLSAAATKEYWDSVRSELKDDRKKKSRGRDKVVQNAMKTSSHIRFE